MGDYDEGTEIENDQEEVEETDDDVENVDEFCFQEVAFDEGEHLSYYYEGSYDGHYEEVVGLFVVLEGVLHRQEQHY